jgi:hypothetical protein
VPLSTTSTISAQPSRPAVAQATPRSPPRGDESKMRVHTGLVDQSALSSKPPNDVMAEVIKVLLEMGMEVKREYEYRLWCTRVRRRKAGATTGLGLGSVMSVGSGMSPFTLMSNASASRVSGMRPDSFGSVQNRPADANSDRLAWSADAPVPLWSPFRRWPQGHAPPPRLVVRCSALALRLRVAEHQRGSRFAHCVLGRAVTRHAGLANASCATLRRALVSD